MRTQVFGRSFSVPLTGHASISYGYPSLAAPQPAAAAATGSGNSIRTLRVAEMCGSAAHEKILHAFGVQVILIV